eukprot:4286011-Pyramimonas_sp.AAC.3
MRLPRHMYISSKHCPGAGCPGYHVVFGTDYVATEIEKQAALLKILPGTLTNRAHTQLSLLEHVKSYPESLVVIEEYDKGLLQTTCSMGSTHELRRGYAPCSRRWTATPGAYSSSWWSAAKPKRPSFTGNGFALATSYSCMLHCVPLCCGGRALQLDMDMRRKIGEDLHYPVTIFD